MIKNSRLVTSAEMKALDDHTIHVMGLPAMVLMERAALAAVEVLRERGFGLARVLCLCGAGNNGGDGFAVARLLFLAGIHVEVLFIGAPEKCSKETITQRKIAENYGVSITENDLSTLLAEQTPAYSTIVDALFGIGGSRPLRGHYREAVEAVNRCGKSGARILSLDIPSGISADTGEILGCAIQADATVTFAFAKLGLTISPGRERAGAVFVKDIGITG